MTGRKKTILALMMSFMLMFVFTACGSGDAEPESEAEPQTETEQQTEAEPQTETEQQTAAETSDEYDIASNLKLAGGDEMILDTDYFRITLPVGPSWDYEIDSKTSITLYNKAAREADLGGRLVSIIAYDAGDNSYLNLPSYGVIGEKNGKMYIAEYPSDIQYDLEDEQAAAEYRAVYDELNKIRDGSGDSPITLK